jgi:molybdopterin/thiamine biosynthesis adenylyltransferase
VILVGLMAAVMWGIGAAMGARRQARWTMIGVLIASVLAIQVLLPDGHPLRAATGGEAALWLMLLGFAGVVVLYRQALGLLRARVVSRQAPVGAAEARGGSFGAAELERYARHIALREIGGSGQRALGGARVLVVGAGGLGSPAIQYLAAAGVGTLGIIDADVVELPNLQRQTIHATASLGMAKVFSAAGAVAALNPHVSLRPYHRRLTEEIAEALFEDYDLILDGSDNFETRYLVNRVAVGLGKPLIAGALTQWEGQVSLYDPAQGGPCYACVFPVAPDRGLVPSCAEAGVAGPLPGVIGSVMALEAVKAITGAGEGLRGRLLIWDGLHGETRVIAVARRPECPVCGSGHEADHSAVTVKGAAASVT